MGTTKELTLHINDKIAYHEKLRIQYEAEEKYELCAYHRDEIARLKRML